MGSDVLSIGISGAQTAQHALSTTGHNIANAQTEGFSRQRVEVGTRIPQNTGVGSLGSGVKITDIGRVHNEFITSNVRKNSSLANGLEINHEYTSQIDNMLADPNAGLAPTLHSFFSSINNVSNDPSSQSARQVMIGEANALSERFLYLDERFENMRQGTNATLRTHIQDVNNLAVSIADVNWKIVLAREVSQGEPNDLLDERDRLLHKLSEKVVVRTNEQEDGSLNVFIGNGQTLILGKNYSQLGLSTNQHDPSQLEVVYENQGARSVVTQFMKGGTIGGLIDFRERILGGAQNELGRIAIGVSKTFNDQHRKGMTLGNELGGDFFNSIDKNTPLTLPRLDNEGDYEFKTSITDVNKLSISDYKLNFNNGEYSLIRQQDQKLIDTFTEIPHEIKSEGFKISLERGTNIANGDSYFIRPTRAAARSFNVEVNLTNDIAAASPVRIRTSVNNMGEMKPEINHIADIDSPSFSTKQGTLSPTLTLRFIDENHIELLDDKGKVVRTQQINEQNKAIPATEGESGENGSVATPDIPSIPASRTDSGDFSKSTSESDEEGMSPVQLGKQIFYDPLKGINFFPSPDGMDAGYNVKLSGSAKAGDVFVIEYNTDAVGDNQNILELGSLQSKRTLNEGSSNFTEVYSQLVSRIGSKTHELSVNKEAQRILYEQSIAQNEEVSGVNIDEEGANLIRYQKAYEANARVIGAANEMFDTLINVLGR